MILPEQVGGTSFGKGSQGRRKGGAGTMYANGRTNVLAIEFGLSTSISQVRIRTEANAEVVR